MPDFLPPCTLLRDDQRRDWCADIDQPTGYVCRRPHGHDGLVHVGRNSAGGFHQWSAAVSDEPADSIPAAIPASSVTAHITEKIRQWREIADRNRGLGWPEQANNVEFPSAMARDLLAIRNMLPPAAPAVDSELDFSALADACEEYVRAYRGSDEPDLPELVDAITKALGRPVQPTVDGDLLHAASDAVASCFSSGAEVEPARSREFYNEVASAVLSRLAADALSAEQRADETIRDLRTELEQQRSDEPRWKRVSTKRGWAEAHRLAQELAEVRAACTRVAREFDSLHSRYTVGPSNALRVVDLLLEDITNASGELRKAAETTTSVRSASLPAIPADAVVLPENWRQQLGWLFTVEDAGKWSSICRLVEMWQGKRHGTDDEDAAAELQASSKLLQILEQAPAIEQKLDELRAQLLDWATVLARGSGDVPAVDVAWKLRQIADGNHPGPAVGSDTDTTDGPWRAGELVLDRTNFVWWRDVYGWRPIARHNGNYVPYRDLICFLGPLTKLTGLPLEMNAVGSVPAEVVAQLRVVPAEQEGGKP